MLSLTFAIMRLRSVSYAIKLLKLKTSCFSHVHSFVLGSIYDYRGVNVAAGHTCMILKVNIHKDMS